MADEIMKPNDNKRERKSKKVSEAAVETTASDSSPIDKKAKKEKKRKHIEGEEKKRKKNHDKSSLSVDGDTKENKKRKKKSETIEESVDFQNINDENTDNAVKVEKRKKSKKQTESDERHKKKKSKKSEEPVDIQEPVQEDDDDDNKDNDDEPIIKKRAADATFLNSPNKVGRAETDWVFVKGLQFGITSEDLKKFFGSCGNILRIRFPTSDHGSAFVQFATFDGAAAAQKFDGQTGPGDMGRYVNVREHTFGRWHNSAAISLNATREYESAIRDALQEFGSIIDIQFFGDNALVVFENDDCADAAVEAGKVNLGDYETWTKLATAKFQYGLDSFRDQPRGGQRGGNRGRGSRGGSSRGGRGGRGGNRW